MNYRFVVKQLGLLFIVLSSLLLAIAAWSGIQLAFGEAAEKHPLRAFLIAGGLGLFTGGLMWLVTRNAHTRFGRKEALLLVAATWFGGAMLSAIPYLVYAHIGEVPGTEHPFREPVSCVFESMSGLTTTGATVLTKIDRMPRSILLWRALTHWLGGLGIVVLFVAVLPSMGVEGKRLFRVEAPGPEPEGVHPHIRETARTLWLIYVGITILQILALRIAGMDVFNSVCHTFATLATGGFSTHNASLGGFHNNIAIDIIVLFFMICAGVNFGLYYHLIRGRFRAVYQDSELRLYLTIMFVVTAIVTFTIANQPIKLTTGETLQPSWIEAARQSALTTVSVQTTTGFCTSDFNLWPFLAKALLLLVMFVGGCAGSTGGGIKVIRVLIAFKVMVAELERVFRPNVVRPLKVGKATIGPELRLATLAYVFGLILLFGAGTGLLKLFEPNGTIDMTTAASASVATLCNIGPGLAKVGAVENYAWFTAPSKCVMIILMALGRLEVFAILVLFSPRFWRTT
ncbi:MAG TPA: TrkH family potassium uptake protein [Phycisphaerae bacterium]|nr:TrkH family potassium uptake protein [Phycisphaerae bacterium]